MGQEADAIRSIVSALCCVWERRQMPTGPLRSPGPLYQHFVVYRTRGRCHQVHCISTLLCMGEEADANRSIKVT
ncbi:hypothetical protein BgiBS90_019803, partial [Biomphalaria glabrata]